MKGSSFFFLLFLLLFILPFLGKSTEGADQPQTKGVYIVYMGAAASPKGSVRADHLQLLSSFQQRKKSALVHNYKHGFSGFAALLSKEEAQLIAQKPGVVSVFPDPVLHLHTTRSWNFLRYPDELQADDSDSGSDSQSKGSDAIIGIIDSGIWPEAKSFSDEGMGPIPSRWNGACMKGANLSSFSCNKKIIGARYYSNPHTESMEDNTPRDADGHGTHVASTAAGSAVTGASFYGVAPGTAKGGSPKSRIAMYRVCTPRCLGSAILAAFDDAIADGVDVLSISLGSLLPAKTNFSTDTIAIGALHAVEKGITVVTSGGNAGPQARTTSNDAPWMLTVGATTIDRDFESDVVLGGNKVIRGHAINFGNIKDSPAYPLIYAKSASNNPSDDEDARKCNPGSLDGDKIKGKIVLCDNGMKYLPEEKMDEVKKLGGVGVILVDDLAESVPNSYGAYPMTTVTSKNVDEIYSYINSTRNPVATILATVTVTKRKPAPVVPYFSSRGPSLNTRNILKPDIAAPGVDILAAWIANDTSIAIKGKEPPLFNVLSGTSMSCPHVSGIAATVKSQNPTWSPSAIRSAIMTTAIQTNNLRTPITTNSDLVANPYDFGSGEVSLSGPLQPGLVYETDISDYLKFLCDYGYSTSKIKLISPALPGDFTCPNNSALDSVSNINYPSIAVSRFNGKQSKTVIRTVTNVGDDDETTYTASVDAPTGLTVQVLPSKLRFTKDRRKLSFRVIFSSTKSSTYEGDAFGSITWTNGKYKVRSPFVVSSGSDDDYDN